jgi:hypothetical protein
MGDGVSAELDIGAAQRVSKFRRRRPGHVLLHNDVAQGIAKGVVLLLELE